eukprot:2524609-Lingulodinium_polyedra.AAC.1
MSKRVAERCRASQRVAACCIAPESVAACCSMSQRVVNCYRLFFAEYRRVLETIVGCRAERCRTL